MVFLRRDRSERRPAMQAARQGLEVRPARIEDAEAITRMARALSLTDGGRPSHLTVEACRRDGFGPRPAFQAMIARMGGEAVGYAAFYWGDDTDTATRGVYVSDLYVTDAYRRLGVGRALMASVAGFCRDQGGRWMFWSVLRSNRAGRQFYRAIARELRDVVVCTAYGSQFDALAEQAG